MGDSSSSTLARGATRSAQRLAVDSGLLDTVPLPEGQGVDVQELLEEGAPERNRRDDDVVLHYKANMSTPDWLPMHPEGVLFFIPNPGLEEALREIPGISKWPGWPQRSVVVKSIERMLASKLIPFDKEDVEDWDSWLEQQSAYGDQTPEDGINPPACYNDEVDWNYLLQMGDRRRQGLSSSDETFDARKLFSEAFTAELHNNMPRGQEFISAHTGTRTDLSFQIQAHC